MEPQKKPQIIELEVLERISNIFPPANNRTLKDCYLISVFNNCIEFAIYSNNLKEPIDMALLEASIPRIVEPYSNFYYASVNVWEYINTAQFQYFAPNFIQAPPLGANGFI